MSPEDAWDWPLLMYVATRILHRPEAQFWRMTPRKLSALVKVHIELNDTEKQKKKEKVGFIDQVL